MKVLLVAVLLVVVGLLAYNVVTTGEVRLLPPAASPEELQLDRLQARLDDAQRHLADAGKSAGKAGDDARTAARREIDEITDQLQELRDRLEAKAKEGAGGARKTLDRLRSRTREKAEKLQRAVDAFKRELQ